jgi:hypothetical protein
MNDITVEELRAAWGRLRLIGDFSSAMREGAVRCVLEAVARAQRLDGLRDPRFSSPGDPPDSMMLTHLRNDGFTRRT